MKLHLIPSVPVSSPCSYLIRLFLPLLAVSPVHVNKETANRVPMGNSFAKINLDSWIKASIESMMNFFAIDSSQMSLPISQLIPHFCIRTTCDNMFPEFFCQDTLTLSAVNLSSPFRSPLVNKLYRFGSSPFETTICLRLLARSRP